MLIYKVTNRINGKIYIGKTSKTLEHRKFEHEKISKGNSNLIFHRAIRKYGIESFKWETLCKCENDEELNLKEIEFINKFNSMPPVGYNISSGGTGGNNITYNPNKKEICKNISMKLKGIKRGKQTPEHNRKDRDTHLGKKDSQKVKDKKSRAHAKSWELILPNGQIVIDFGICLKKYCNDNQLSYQILRKKRGEHVLYDKRIVKTKTIGCKLTEVPNQDTVILRADGSDQD